MTGFSGTIAITGATGFIGNHLLSRFNEAEISTRSLYRKSSKKSLPKHGTNSWIDGNTLNARSLKELMSGADICIHLAGATKAINQSGYHEANVVASHMVAACAYKAGVKHFILVSSLAARKPELSSYAASKSSSETALGCFQQSGMRVSIIRPPAVIGPGDPMLKPVFDFIKLGWLPAPAEPRAQSRHFAVISVDDLVAEIVRIAISNVELKDISEPCSLKSATWANIAEAAGDHSGKQIRILPLPTGALKIVGLCGDFFSKLLRKPLSLSSGKVRELLQNDWTLEKTVTDAMDLNEIIGRCLPQTSKPMESQ